ncbi:hypothetical protein HOD41_00085 [bacterium]|nr:hypothetical protein [bacterium]
MTVVPIRASRFEVGGTGGGTYVTQSAAGHIEVVGSYIELGILNGASVIAVTASDVRFGNLSLEYNWEIPPMPGADSFYFVSGSIGAKDGGTATTSVFGGDLVVSGNMHALNGITGSITKLTNGSSYMVAGTNMTLTTGTNGDVTFDAAGGGGSSYWFEDTAGFVATYTTGTVAISGGSGVEAAQLGAGLDTNFWVSGSTEDQIDGDTPHITTFGGHVVVSGAIYGGENPFGPGTRLLNLRSDVIAMHSSQLGEYGDDVAIVLQGTQGSKNSSTRGVTEFTGDVHISGSRTGGSAYGGMYAYTTGSEQTLVANTPEIVDWGALNASEMSGSAFGASPDIVSNNIAITQPGPWNVSFNASFSGTAESVVNLECRFGAEIQNHIAAQTVLNQVGSAMSVSAAGIIDVPEGGGFLELWVESNNTAITFKRLSMFATSL